MGYQLMLAQQPNLDGISNAKRTRHGCSLEEDSYQVWIRNHPSALKMFDEMMSKAKNKRVVVFLDYDGTLSPIVKDPDQAFMSEPMRSAVRDVSNRFPTAIISGRSRDKVYDFVRLENVYYAGSHGMDIAVVNLPSMEEDAQCKSKDLGGQEIVLCQPAKEYLPELQKIYEELIEKTQETKGAAVENNRFCLTVHFRRVDEKDWSSLEAQVVAIIKKYPKFHLTRGRKVLEIRPSIKWDKGNALEYILHALGFGTSNDILPVYIGDDRTDEDAFKVLRKRKMGYPIIVSSKPKETRAAYSLRDPSEVKMFLSRLAKWGRSGNSNQSSKLHSVQA